LDILSDSEFIADRKDAMSFVGERCCADKCGCAGLTIVRPLPNFLGKFGLVSVGDRTADALPIYKRSRKTIVDENDAFNSGWVRVTCLFTDRSDVDDIANVLQCRFHCDDAFTLRESRRSKRHCAGDTRNCND